MDGFIIIGNGGAVSYKEIFPLIKENKMWLGYKPFGGEMYFHITDEYKEEIVKTKKEGTGWVEIDGEVIARVTQACWFTNLEYSKRKAFIGLTRKYNPTDYPKYDDYDAINVDWVSDIPKDYDGIMGVPISFMGKYNPNQFELIGIDRYVEDNQNKGHRFHINGKEMTARLLIRKVKDRRKKDFIIIGNGNAVTYKEIFPLIKENKMWVGAGKGMGGKAMEFVVDASIYDTNKGSVNRIENGKCYVGVMMCTWFTNVSHSKRNTPLDLYKKYTAEEYPKYDNYDAIEVSRVENIPTDYDGVMGVPISFLDKYCPMQFEIVGLDSYVEDNPHYGHRFTINGKETYARILIRKVKDKE